MTRAPMGVLNFAHGAFLTLGAYAGWELAAHTGDFGIAALAAITAGALTAAATELILIRPLYGKPVAQILVTVGLDLALAGLLNSVVFSGALVDPTQGDQLLIFAFIVVVIGGLGSIPGAALAALAVGLVQVYVGFYAGTGAGLAQLGNVSVVGLLAIVLLIRPRGLGRAA